MIECRHLQCDAHAHPDAPLPVCPTHLDDLAADGVTGHGTRKRYQRGCHCRPCTDDHARYSAAYVRINREDTRRRARESRDARRQLGREPMGGLVDAEPTRARLEWLIADRGWRYEDLVAELQTSRAVIAAVRLGRRGRVRWATARRVHTLAAREASATRREEVAA